MATFEANQNNGNETPQGASGGVGGAVHTTHGCTYKEFLNYQLYNFKGTKGAVGLTRWFEKMESVFHISNCATNFQVKYATCTMLDSVLTWWNSHVKTVGIDNAYDIIKKKTKKKSKEKRLEDIPIVRDFSKVFPEDLPGLPLTRKVEFQIDLVSGDAPMA
ncbi:hypothetical protein Tco_0435781 [Tanacetum coccineum]